MSGVRQNLGKCPEVLLRRLLLSSGSLLRLRFPEEKSPPRDPGGPNVQYVALCRTLAASRRLYACPRRRRDASGCFAETRVALGDRRALFQERCGVLPFSVV